jgi:hypothetical protein
MLWQIEYSIYAFGLTKLRDQRFACYFKCSGKTVKTGHYVWYDYPKNNIKAAIPEYTPMCASFSGKFHKKDLL